MPIVWGAPYWTRLIHSCRVRGILRERCKLTGGLSRAGDEEIEKEGQVQGTRFLVWEGKGKVWRERNIKRKNRQAE